MLTPNTILRHRYRIIQKLGSGGMGAVYQAMDESLNCLVAVKEAFSVNESHRRAFRREAELLANLRHPALPKVMEHFTENQGDFLVMEFIPGHDLAELLALRGRPFSESEVLGWADELLNVLSYLHAKQLFHRDIKPSNLKLTTENELFLIDFGLAKGAVGQMPTVVTTKSERGYTPGYAPLEQMLGQGTDARSDIYSLGATLYHLLTGSAPLNASRRFEFMEEEGRDRLPLIQSENPLVSPHVAGIIHRAMEISRKRRPASAAEMRAALRGSSPAQPERPRPGTTTPPPPRPTERSPEPAPPNPAPPEPTMKVGPPPVPPPLRSRIFTTEDGPAEPQPQTRGSFLKPLLIGLGIVAGLVLLSFVRAGLKTGWWPWETTTAAIENVNMTNRNAATAAPSPSPSPSASATPRPGTVVKNKMGMDLVYVPAGSFMMGSKEGNPEEKPIHRVTIANGFYMGKFEVTQAQWQSIMANNPSHYQDCGVDCPVESVSWNDIQAFIEVLNRGNDGFSYRLPSEAEWEYACRAGATGSITWPLDRVAWYSAIVYDVRTGEREFPPDFSPTHPVGLKRPNAFGLHDMQGNVIEWCQDWYHSTYTGSPNNGSPWLSSGEQRERVLRGGSSFLDDSYLRFARRYKASPETGGEVVYNRFEGYGFRLVAVPRTP